MKRTEWELWERLQLLHDEITGNLFMWLRAGLITEKEAKQLLHIFVMEKMSPLFDQIMKCWAIEQYAL